MDDFLMHVLGLVLIHFFITLKLIDENRHILFQFSDNIATINKINGFYD